MSKRYLAIAPGVEPYIEESAATVAHVLANDLEVAFYQITVDPETDVPSLSQRVTLSTAPRTVTKVRETVSLEAGGQSIDSAEIESDAP